MLRGLLSVGAMTLLSRATGFFRDVILGAVLGADRLADAFVVAFRLPNHFRAIFGEGAFNAAYVPSYARTLETEGKAEAGRFASEIFTLLLASQLVLLVIAWALMPWLVDLLAPGFRDDPEKFAAAVTMTRITFPYLLFITLVTMQSGTLNAHGKFAVPAFAPVLLNVVMMGFLALAYLFPDAGQAASWGVTVSGLLQFILLLVASTRAGVMEHLARPAWDAKLKQFFTTLGPAVIGSAGVQIALFADTIIASLLPPGGPSSLYYADRIYQLPVGVLGIAAGTVLLPEMSRRIAAGNRAGAMDVQSRTMALSLALTAPFFVAFIMVPETIMRGVFLRGAFSAEAAAAAAAVLEAYGFGLIAVVLIRASVASFQAEGDTKTPMRIVLASVAVNLVLKLLLFKSYGAAGLAGATSAGAWVNLALLVAVALRRGVMQPNANLGKTAAAVAIAAFGLALFTLFADVPAARFAAHLPRLANETRLAILALGGGVVYVVILVLGLELSGIRLMSDLLGRKSRAASR